MAKSGAHRIQRAADAAKRVVDDRQLRSKSRDSTKPWTGGFSEQKKSASFTGFHVER